jgi:hypothetical protein
MSLPEFMIGKFWFSSELEREVATNLMTTFLGSDTVVYANAGCVFELKQPAAELLLELVSTALERDEIYLRIVVAAANLKNDLTAWLEAQP